jgi:hypothetical protein
MRVPTASWLKHLGPSIASANKTLAWGSLVSFDYRPQVAWKKGNET